MSKIGTKRMWRICLLGSALTMVLAIGSLIGATSVQASATALEVGDYKGDRAEADWIVPEEEGKIFAGWYTDTDYDTVYTKTTGTAYPKFVDEKVLTVKKQLASGTENTSGTTNIRFLTAIDSRMFKGVTFDVSVPESGKHWIKTETVAYSSMLVDGDETPKYADDIFGTEDAKFFVAHKFTGIPNAAFGHGFIVTPSWETMDGTVVTGETLNFTINGELLAGSLFADKVVIGERTEDSAVQSWDISQVEDNQITGTNLTDGEVMWFKATGNEAVAQMTVTRKDTSGTGREYQPLAAVGLSDGTGYGHIGVRAHGVICSGAWIENALVPPVLISSNSRSVIELEIVLHNGQILVYVDGLYVVTVDVEQVIAGTTADTNFAFSVVMSSFGKVAELEFSNIRFATGRDAVNKFFVSKSIFAESVQVNGAIVASQLDRWVYNAEDASVTGTHTNSSQFYMEPIYFKETGRNMSLKTTVTNVSQPIKDRPFVGLYITDGTEKGGFGVFDREIKYGQWHTDAGVDLGYAVLTEWDENPSIELEIALKDENFYIYVDGIYAKKLAVNTVMFNGTSNGDLAFGLTMRSEKGQPTSLKFSDISFSTKAADVDKFFLEKAGFAESVQVNGTTMTSQLDKWDYSNVINGSLRTTKALGGKAQPMYFAQTGNAMLLKTTVSVTTSTAGDPSAGIYISDGTRTAWIGVRGTGLYCCPADAGDKWLGDGYWPNQEISTWGKTTADITIALKNGTLYFSVEGKSKTVPLSDVMPNLATDAKLAFGIYVWTQAEREYDITFSNVDFTTDATKVDDFFLMESPLFAQEISVNGKTMTSLLPKWVYNSTEQSVVGTDTTASSFYMAPIYFNETGNAMLLKTTITNVSNPMKKQPLGGLYITDGTNTGGFGVLGGALKYGQWLDHVAGTLPNQVLVSWGNASAQLEVALKDNQFYTYVDGVYVTKLSVNSVMFSGTSSGELAFGLTMRAEGAEGTPTSLKFSNITFTTDATAVDAFLTSKETQ